jgi:membrane-associated phospholipid phosphatase
VDNFRKPARFSDHLRGYSIDMDVPGRSLSMRLAVAAVLAVLLLVPFALLWALIAGSWAPLHALDLGVTDGLHGFALGHRGWVGAMAVWSYAFDPNFWRLGALVLVVWLVRRGAVPVAWWVVITMTVGGALGALLKLLVGRDRPDLLEPVAQATGYSFPSGHALNSALGAAVFLLVLLPFTRDRPGRRAALWAVVIAVPLVTGVCRVGLGVHWTSDVVAGWLLGVAVPAATAAGFEAWRRGSDRGAAEIAAEGVEPEIAART